MIDVGPTLPTLGVGATLAYGAWLGHMAANAHTRIAKLEGRQKDCKCSGE